PLALRLRVAPADGDHLLGVALLQRRRLREVGGEALVRLLADRAGVEDDHVGVGLPMRLPQAERLEQPFDPLRIVGVHLTPEGRDVVALHSRGNASRISTRSGLPPFFKTVLRWATVVRGGDRMPPYRCLRFLIAVLV